MDSQTFVCLAANHKLKHTYHLLTKYRASVNTRRVLFPPSVRQNIKVGPFCAVLHHLFHQFLYQLPVTSAPGQITFHSRQLIKID